jgi:hypothetical protein
MHDYGIRRIDIAGGYNFFNVGCRFNGSTVTIDGTDNSTTISNPGTNTVWNQGQGLVGLGTGGGPDNQGTFATGQCPLCTAGTVVVAQLSSTQSGGFPGTEGTYLLNQASNVATQTA